MKNYDKLAELVKGICISPTSDSDLFFWNSRAEHFNSSSRNGTFFKFNGKWCLYYNYDTKLFKIPEKFPVHFQSLIRHLENGEEYILSTGDDAIDFQNAMLYNVVSPNDQTFNIITEYIKKRVLKVR